MVKKKNIECEEFKEWFERAGVDLRTARNSLKSGDYYASVFWCQQAVEKGFKSVLLKKKGKIRRIHDLVELGRDIDFPLGDFEGIKELTLGYIYSKYPGIPMVTNLKEKAFNFISLTEGVLKWVEEKL